MAKVDIPERTVAMWTDHDNLLPVEAISLLQLVPDPTELVECDYLLSGLLDATLGDILQLYHPPCQRRRNAHGLGGTPRRLLPSLSSLPNTIGASRSGPSAPVSRPPCSP